MLKLVRKIEKKQFIAGVAEHEKRFKLRSTELGLLVANPVHVNTGQYRALAATTRKIKDRLEKPQM